MKVSAYALASLVAGKFSDAAFQPIDNAHADQKLLRGEQKNRGSWPVADTDMAGFDQNEIMHRRILSTNNSTESTKSNTSSMKSTAKSMKSMKSSKSMSSSNETMGSGSGTANNSTKSTKSSTSSMKSTARSSSNETMGSGSGTANNSTKSTKSSTSSMKSTAKSTKSMSSRNETMGSGSGTANNSTKSTKSSTRSTKSMAKSTKSSKSMSSSNETMGMPIPPACSPKRKINVACIPKFVTPLVIPPVIHDDHGQPTHVEISLRQIEQQVLPEGFPKTKQWAYGIPGKPKTFNNPAGTIEVTKDVRIQITWLNELVKDPETCRCNPNNFEACQFLKHVVQDACGDPLIDQTLHWANPQMKCKSGEKKTDCTGISAEVYNGPVPSVVHVHGAHVGPGSDGYPEAWWLPAASNLPEGYATEGTYYESATRDDAFEDYSIECSKKSSKSSKSPKSSKSAEPLKKGRRALSKKTAVSQGHATDEYTNDQPTTTLWYHDHTLGITRLNVYAAAAGFYLIRTVDDSETGLVNGTLPGPPPKIGEDPNNDLNVRKKIREIPLAIQPKSFYEDGSLWFPANRAFFQDGSGNNGTIYADNSGDIPGENVNLTDYSYLPENDTDIHPVWNPEVFFETMVVNGKTWPYLQVASERYRFRLLNAADSRFLNLALFVKRANATCGDVSEEIPFYVFGSDQGLLPKVVKVMTGSVDTLGGDDSGGYMPPSLQALLMSPAERYDVIVDFSGLYDGDEVFMVNTGPDEPFGGFEEGEGEDPERPTGQVMKFGVCTALNDPDGDPSTPPDELTLNHTAPGGDPPLEEGTERFLRLDEVDSNTTAMPTGPTYDGPVQALLGTNESKKWEDPIATTVTKDRIEDWVIDNWTADAHPIHLHQVKFRVLKREKMVLSNDALDDLTNKEQCSVYHTCIDREEEEEETRDRRRLAASTANVSDVLVSPIENGWKDTVISYPGEKTTIRAKFDISGLFVWHCHILSHEDNEMMLPFCVSTNGTCAGADGCPAELC